MDWEGQGTLSPCRGNLSHENEERRSSASGIRNRAREPSQGLPASLPAQRWTAAPGRSRQDRSSAAPRRRALPPGKRRCSPAPLRAPRHGAQRRSSGPAPLPGPAGRRTYAQEQRAEEPQQPEPPHGPSRAHPIRSDPTRAAPPVPSRVEPSRAGRAADINASTRFRPGRGRRGRPSCSHRAYAPATKSPPAAPAAPGLSRAAERSQQLCGAGALPAALPHGVPGRATAGCQRAAAARLLLPG